MAVDTTVDSSSLGYCPSSFFFLPFITLGAELRLAVRPVDCLRLASGSDLILSAVVVVVVLLVAAVSDGFFFSSSLALPFYTGGWVVALLVVTGLLPAPAFLSLATTWVTPPALILSFKLSSIGSASSLP